MMCVTFPALNDGTFSLMLPPNDRLEKLYIEVLLRALAEDW